MSTVSAALSPAAPVSQHPHATKKAHCTRVAAQGEHLLHVLNTLGSRKVVLEAELREIDEDISQNACMARKYGDDFFTEGTARLAQTRVCARRSSV